ncbi:hypothetical protein HCH_04718 [Hahella chejuensis KCTC 2396]|uniref:Uncharacterized protein n=1 Tax=Hahella chejuensis (strain KCTC 2396) TaxID=349521 RepID=Q2SD58_HAHCH|nr:hypothetical protein HCH_04718 [Hahella chejuensis KCTC 2396]
MEEIPKLIVVCVINQKKSCPDRLCAKRVDS